MDQFTPEVRSRVMSRIRSRNTKPEIVVRCLLHRLGYRFRLHRADLPGKPDIVLPKHRTVIIINGCFWHRHPGCKRATMPKSNQIYWDRKLQGNVERDADNTAALLSLGWRVIVVWECETRNSDQLREQLTILIGK